MSSCSRVQALLQSVEEMARLIASLMIFEYEFSGPRRQRLPGGVSPFEKSGGDVVDLTTRRAAAVRSTRAVGAR